MPVVVRRLIALLLCLAQMGCVTHWWLSDSTYDETIRSFMVSADGRELVVMGDQHHYIFAAPDDLITVLNWSGRAAVKPDFWGFEANFDKMRGWVNLSVPADAVDDAGRAFLESAGFKPALDKSYPPSCTRRIKLEGRRYNAGEVGIPASVSFARPYTLTVTLKTPPDAAAAKLLATPITVAADGLLFIGGVALVLVICPVVTVMEGRCMRGF